MRRPLTGSAVLPAAMIPKRARSFCKPLTDELKAGVYFHCPVAVDFRYSGSSCFLRSTQEDGELLIVGHHDITAPAQLFLSDIDPEYSDTLQLEYRRIVGAAQFPPGKERHRLNDLLYSSFSDGDTEGGALQVWVGGFVYTATPDKLLLKGTANLYPEQKLEVLDAIVNTSGWHGWLAPVVRAREEDGWIHLSESEPLAKGIIDLHSDIDLEIIELEDCPPEVLMDPLRWSAFDPAYGKPPGKYLREMTKRGKWDTSWSVERLEPQTGAEVKVAPKALPEPIGPTDRCTFFRDRLVLRRGPESDWLQVTHNGRTARFPGAELVALLSEVFLSPETSASTLSNGEVATEEECVEILQRLVDGGIMRRVEGESLGP